MSDYDNKNNQENLDTTGNSGGMSEENLQSSQPQQTPPVNSSSCQNNKNAGSESEQNLHQASVQTQPHANEGNTNQNYTGFGGMYRQNTHPNSQENQPHSSSQNTNQTHPNTDWGQNPPRYMAAVRPNFIVPSKEPLKHDKIDSIFVWVMLLIGYLFVKLILAGNFNLGTTVFFAALLCSVLLWFHFKKIKAKPALSGYIVCIVLGSIPFAILDDTFLKLLLACLLLTTTIYYTMARYKIRLFQRLNGFFICDIFAGWLELPFRKFFALVSVIHKDIKSKFSSKNNKVQTNKTKSRNYLLLGLLCSIPVTAFVLYLLMGADDYFNSLVSNAFGWIRFDFIAEDINITLAQFALGFPIGCYGFSILFHGQHFETKGRKERLQREYRSYKKVPTALMVGLLMPVLLVYLVFFLSQLSYYLAAFQNILPQGLNYAENARKGFFELCGVSFINFLLIFILVYFLKKEEKKNKVRIVLSLLLSFTTIVLIVMALLRMKLYTDVYGLTPLRVYVTWFILLLLIVFILITAKVLSVKFNAIKYGVIACVVMFLALCYLNPEKFIAEYNTEMYLSGKLDTIDVELLTRLDTASVPARLKLINSGKLSLDSDEFKELILGLDAVDTKFLYETSPSDDTAVDRPDWRNYNFTKDNAYKHHGEIKSLLDKHENIIDKYYKESDADEEDNDY